MTEINAKPPWVECPTVYIDLEHPVQSRYANLPDYLLKASRCLLDTITDAIPKKIDPIADLVRLRTMGRFCGEFHRLGKMVGVKWRRVALANISYDLLLNRIGCTTLALPTPDGPVIARNMDWWPEDRLAWASCLVHYERNGEPCFSNAGWTGVTGVVTGQSARGFAVIMNAVCNDEPMAKTGYPVMLHMRRVLEDAQDFEHALKLLSETKLLAPVLFTLVGSENDQRVVIERSPRRHALRWAEPNEPLMTTNDYRLLERPKTSDCCEVFQTTCDRYRYLDEHFFHTYRADHTPTDEELLYTLSDGNVAQSITAQHVIMHPRSNKIRLFVPRHLLKCAKKKCPGEG